jgi:uncharacterized protein
MKIVTPSLFYQYAACPHWIWYDKFGDQSKRGAVPELAQKLMEQGVVHEMEYVKDLSFEHVATKDAKDAVAQTMKLMKAGAELIYQGMIEAEISSEGGSASGGDGVVWRGRPDLLEKRLGKSKFGDWYYAPVDIKSAHTVHDEHALQLGLYAAVLREVQGALPKEAAIINIDGERIAQPISKALIDKTGRRVREIEKVLDGEKPPLKLGTKCKHSPWFEECIRSAEEADDVCLVYNVHQKTLTDLRANGIKTVHDAAKMNVEALPKITHASEATLTRIKLQAQSLIENKMKWIGTPSMPEASFELYFDIEGDPLLDVQYLFGFWVRGDAGGKYATIGKIHRDPGAEGYYLYFLAEKPEDEQKMWQDFLQWIELLPYEDLVVYHYAPYERVQIDQLAAFHGGSEALTRFRDCLVDLAKVVQASVIFPTYFYSIKNLAKFFDHKWRHKKAGGAQSIFWYEQWLETGDRNVLQDIIEYNEDDVIATHGLHAWLKKNG